MKRATKLAVQLLASAALMWLLLSKIGIEEVANKLRVQDAGAVGLIVALLAAQFGIGMLRWRMICAALGVTVPGRRIMLGWVGMAIALSQVLPSIGGDGYRVLALGRRSGIGAATRTVVAERVVGLLTLSALTLPLSLAALSQTRSPFAFGVFAALSAAVLMAGAVAGVVARLLARWTASRLIRLIAADFAVLYSKSTLLPVFGASLVIHALSVSMVVCVATTLALDEVLWWHASVVVPGTLLVSAIPISLGGWGIRESSMVFGLTALGVSDAVALALSIGFGLTIVAAGVMGFILWIAAAGQRDSL